MSDLGRDIQMNKSESKMDFWLFISAILCNSSCEDACSSEKGQMRKESGQEELMEKQ